MTLAQLIGALQVKAKEVSLDTEVFIVYDSESCYDSVKRVDIGMTDGKSSIDIIGGTVVDQEIEAKERYEAQKLEQEQRAVEVRVNMGRLVDSLVL